MAMVTSAYDGAPYDDSIVRFLDYGDEYVWDRVRGRKVTRESLQAYQDENKVDLSGEIGAAPDHYWSEANKIDGVPIGEAGAPTEPTEPTEPPVEGAAPDQTLPDIPDPEKPTEPEPPLGGEGDKAASEDKEWSKMSSHSDLNSFLASHPEVEQPSNWSTMTIAQKKAFFDDNTTLVITT